MSERRSESTSSYDRLSFEEYRRRSASGTPTEQRQSLEVGQQSSRRRSPLATEAETLSYDSPDEEDDDQDRSPWGERRSTSRSPKDVEDLSPRDKGKGKAKGKGKEREMSSSANSQSRMGGTSYERERTASSTSERRPQGSRASTTSTATTSRQASRQASEEARGDRREERKDSGSSRSRLVSGVFVRY